MKTLIIYTDYESLPFYQIVDGDFSHLDKFITNVNHDDETENELSLLLDNMKSEFPLNDVRAFTDEDKVISVGFAP